MIDYDVFTSKGGREYNEDAYDVVIERDSVCLIMCDGLGGHANGEVASNTAVKTINTSFKRKPIVSENNLADLIQTAQDQIITIQKNDENMEDIRTTLTCVLVNGTNVIAGHVGDSRIYVVKRNGIHFQSEDHSLPYALYKAGRIKEREIRTHEDSNRVLRTLGMEWDSPRYEITRVNDVMPGDGVILCSDGFWEYIYEKEIVRSFKRSKNVRDWLQRMNRIIEKRQKSNADNCTAVIAIVGE